MPDTTDTMVEPFPEYQEHPVPVWGCQHHQPGPDVRNLIVFIDGGANLTWQNNTNVVELSRLILRDREAKQLCWFDPGIGTYTLPSWSLKYFLKVIAHKIDVAISWNFERPILDAYRWLSKNYQIGDRIFLYGFSRGAFQVRVLSAMIDKVGLMCNGNENLIPIAYDLYASPENHAKKGTGIVAWLRAFFRNNKKPSRNDVNVAAGTINPQNRPPGDTSEEPMSGAGYFKKSFSYPDVHVHYVGVWDTVSSIGITREKYNLARTIEGMKHVCYFRQALALDERRVKFLATPKENPTSAENMQENLSGDSPPQTLEAWFPGTHSDIGGESESTDRSRLPLRWMVSESVSAGLRTKAF